MQAPESEVIHTERAPKAIGPYSQAIRAGQFLFTAGQVAIDPATGSLVEGGIEAETRQVLRNLTAVLQSAGVDLPNVVKTTVFMQDLGEFAQMNEVYGEFFGQRPPARSTVQVAALPRGARIEIECVALLAG